MTLTKINKELKEMGYELIKGNKYFYFSPLNNNPKFVEPITYVRKLNELTLHQWKSELDFLKIYAPKVAQ
ncbi:MAG: hypothetical protein HWN79_19325 [Candidatus Lokiarchaeota archaeon]|jgi:hypothetical protein|nr:hypothetical protein [Candidatus Lokiarchaeota archaeon]